MSGADISGIEIGVKMKIEEGSETMVKQIGSEKGSDASEKSA